MKMRLKRATVFGMMIIMCFVFVGCGGKSKKQIAKEKAKEFVNLVGTMNDNSTYVLLTIAELVDKWGDKYQQSGIICAQNMLDVYFTDNIDAMKGHGTQIETLFWKTEYDITNENDKAVIVQQCYDFRDAYNAITEYDEKAYQILQEIKENDEEIYNELKEYYIVSSDYGTKVQSFSVMQATEDNTYPFLNSAISKKNQTDELRKRVELDYK